MRRVSSRFRRRLLLCLRFCGLDPVRVILHFYPLRKFSFVIHEGGFVRKKVNFESLDMLVIGTGKHIRPLSPQTRQYLASLGMRVEAIDTRNAAAQFNLLATERGVSEIAGALIPIGWQEGVGAK